MPAIIFSRIYAFGTVYDVFAVSEPPSYPESFYDVRDKNAETVFILPSLLADASVTSYKNPSPSPSAALAAAAFLTFVRGLPLEEVDIESEGERFKILLLPKRDNLQIFLPKCKLICAKRDVIVEKIKISVSDVNVNGRRISLIRCDDFSAFDSSGLSRIIFESSEFAPDGAVAYSLAEGCATAASKFINSNPDSILCAALAVARAEGVGTLIRRLSVKISDAEILVESAGSHFAASDGKIKYLTLAAPDIL